MRVMEIRIAGRMPQSPVRKATIILFDDRSESDAQGDGVIEINKIVQVHRRLELKPMLSPVNGNGWNSTYLSGRHALPVGIEAVNGPI